MLLSKKNKLELNKLVTQVPSYKWEELIMKGDCDTIYDCLSRHFMSCNEFNKSWLLSRMRKILNNRTEIPSYFAGIMYADSIGRQDLAREFKEQLCIKYPLVGCLYSSGLSLMLKFYNPYK